MGPPNIRGHHSASRRLPWLAHVSRDLPHRRVTPTDSNPFRHQIAIVDRIDSNDSIRQNGGKYPPLQKTTKTTINSPTRNFVLNQNLDTNLLPKVPLLKRRNLSNIYIPAKQFVQHLIN